MTNAPKPGDQLQRSSRISTQTCMYPPWRTQRAQPSRIMGEVPETVPLDFTEDEVTGVASKLSGAAGELGAEAIELQKWLLRFGCASEKFRGVVARLADWMDNSSPPWAAYRVLMAFHLVVLDKRSVVRPLSAAGDKATSSCWNLLLWSGIEAGIE